MANTRLTPLSDGSTLACAQCTYSPRTTDNHVCHELYARKVESWVLKSQTKLGGVPIADRVCTFPGLRQLEAESHVDAAA